MVVEVGGKTMTAIVSGHEVEIVCVGWVECRLDGFESRVGDGAWGQACVFIGIVGRVDAQIFFADVAVKISQCVDDGGVGLQAHVFLQAVVEDRGYHLAFAVEPGFLFNQGGECDGLVQVKIQFVQALDIFRGALDAVAG